MQPISNLSTSSPLRILLQGDPWTGKTTLACQFPGAYVIDVDLNLSRAIGRMQELKLQLPIGYDVLDRDESGAAVAPQNRYDRFIKLAVAAEENPAIQTIIIDSATTFADVLEAYIRKLQPALATAKDKRQFFGFFWQYGRNFMDVLKGFRKHIILICHEKLKTDTEGNPIYPYKVAWAGQMGDMMGAFFTDVWRCASVEKVEGGRKVNKFVVQTAPTYKHVLGDSLGLPDEFEFKWELIEEKLKARIK